jgi:hypothetical protein
VPDAKVLLACITDGPEERRWPAVQAMLARGEADQLLAVRALTLRAVTQPGGRDAAILSAFNLTVRGRLPVLPTFVDVPVAEHPAVLRTMVLTGFVPRPSSAIADEQAMLRMLSDESAPVRELLLLLSCQLPDWSHGEAPLRRAVRHSVKPGSVDPQLAVLLRPRLDSGRREQLIASFRDYMSGGNREHRAADLDNVELDVVPADLVADLVAALQDPQLRQFARSSLRNVGPEAVPALFTAIRGSAPSARHELFGLFPRMAVQTPSMVRGLAEEAFPGDGKRGDGAAGQALRTMRRDLVVAELTPRLRAIDCPARLISFVRNLRDPELDAVLAQRGAAALAVDPAPLDGDQRWELFRGLGEQGDRGFERMTVLLRHDDNGVRRDAVRAFANKAFDRRERVDVLLPLLDADDVEFARGAVVALGRDTTRRNDVVAALLQHWDRRPALRADFAEALGGLGADAALARDRLETLLGGPDDIAQLAAACALLRLDGEHAAAAAAIERMIGGAPEVCCRALARLRRDPALLPRFAEAIVPRLASDDVGVQQQVLYALSHLDAQYSQRVAKRVRELVLSTDALLSMWATKIAQDKLGDR